MRPGRVAATEIPESPGWRTEVGASGLVAIALIVLAYAAVSRMLSGSATTAAMVFVAGGILASVARCRGEAKANLSSRQTRLVYSEREVEMNSKSMAGWIGFAGILMVLVGGIDFIQGLIGLFDDDYYVVTASGFLAFDLTGWGWIMVIWGVLLVLAGLGLLAGQGWARWFAIVVVSLNFIAELGFLGNSQYPLWSLTVIALNIIVLYALTARWSESQAEMGTAAP